MTRTATHDGPGRPLGSWTFPTESIIAALQAADGMVYLAAKKIGCHPDTVCQRISKEPEVKAVYDQCRGQFVDVAETALKAAVLRGEAWAVKFALKCLAKDRGYIEGLEISGKLSADVRAKEVTELPDSELERIVAEELARKGPDTAAAEAGEAAGPEADEPVVAGDDGPSREG